MSPWSLAVGFLPVVLFLIGLVAMDSYRLLRRRQVAISIAWGVVAAVVAFIVQRTLLDRAGVDPLVLRRYVAPVFEELLKSALVIGLVFRARVGFLVDAAVHGFAAGAGFALIENVWYAQALGEPNPWLWVVRGLGTAVLHGSTTAIVGIVTKGLADRHAHSRAWVPLPGLALAIAVHSAYNHLALNPLFATAIVLLAAPVAMLGAFEMSERSTRDWVGHGLDRDADLLELIHTGAIAHSPAGEYLTSLRSRFPGPTVADMLCLLEIRLELALRVKGLLLAREAGLEPPPDPHVIANLRELRFLEHSVGPTGRLAMRPLLPEGRERWQIRLLEGREGIPHSKGRDARG
jgi:RsiW-degrading membrane proteinase PrsW (M82 family)